MPARVRLGRSPNEPRPPSKHAAPRTLSKHELDLLDAYWRAANYLSVGQIYLLDNPLLREPLDGRSTSSRGCSATGAPRPA